MWKTKRRRKSEKVEKWGNKYLNDQILRQTEHVRDKQVIGLIKEGRLEEKD